MRTARTGRRRRATDAPHVPPGSKRAPARVRVTPPLGAKKATARGDLQLRMQGNSFLGAFFRVSPFLKINNISDETFLATVKKQYQKKFGRFGDDVVTSNMTVMEQGFSRVQEIKLGQAGDADRSSMRNPPVKPVGNTSIIPTAGCASACGTGIPSPAQQTPRYAFQTLAKFDSEYRNGLGYHQPAGALTQLFGEIRLRGAGDVEFGARDDALRRRLGGGGHQR